MSDTLPINELVGDFERSLRAQRKASKTIRSYTSTVRHYTAWAAKNGRSVDALAVARPDIEAWLIGVLDTHTPSTAASYYRYFQQFWRWLVEMEGERDSSPMVGMSPPKIPERPVPVFADEDMTKLLKVVGGRDFESRRDNALIRLFRATGVRLGEMTGMTLDALARDEQAVLVVGKGDRGRWVPYGPKAAQALDRYLRDRRRHPQAHLPDLWIGQRGRLTESGITQVLRRRGREAGVLDVRPHRFRHDAAHRSQAAGLGESDLMEVFGWKTSEMVRRYGASARAERARAAYRKLDIEGDL